MSHSLDASSDWRVGLFFHTLFPADAPEIEWRGKPRNQGRVIESISNGTAFKVRLFSFIDGIPASVVVKPASYLDGAVFYQTEREWVAGYARLMGNDADEALTEHDRWKKYDTACDRETISRSKEKRSPGVRKPTPDPRAISKRLRFRIFVRDQFKCRYCGIMAVAGELHVDHVVPISRGGKDEESNLVTACANCNLGKGATTLDERP